MLLDEEADFSGWTIDPGTGQILEFLTPGLVQYW